MDKFERDFKINFYRWCLEECQNEVKSDFAKMRNITIDAAQLFVRYARTLPFEDQIKLAVGYVKHFSKDTMSILGEESTPEEIELVNKYGAYRSSGPYKFWKEFVDERDATGLIKTKPRKLVARAIKEFTPILGPPSSVDNSSVFFETAINDQVVIRTIWSVSAKITTKMEYDHVMGPAQQDLSFPFLGFFDFCRWFGLGKAGWLVPYESDIDPAFDSMTSLFLYFINEVGKFMPNRE